MTPLQPLNSTDFAKLFSTPPPVVVPPALPPTITPPDGKSSNTLKYIGFALLACGMFAGFYYLVTLIEDRNKEMLIALTESKTVPAIVADPKPAQDSQTLKQEENENTKQSII